MYFDMHNHTDFAKDGTMSVEDLCKFAGQIGIGVGVCEHFDYNIGRIPKLDVPAYICAYEKYKSDRFLLGIEIGLTDIGHELNSQMAALEGFDYINGSVHTTNDVSIFEIHKQQDLDMRQFYENHFAFMLDMVRKNDFFHILCHIDYIFRMYVGKWQKVDYFAFSDYYDAVFKTLIEKGIVLEINTVRLHEAEPLADLCVLYRRYKDLGGQYVAVGSDAHHMYEAGRNVVIAFAVVEELGLTAVRFKDKKMISGRM